MQFYYEGRRQLQPPVRLRTTSHSSGPTLAEWVPTRATVSLIMTLSMLGRMDRCSELATAGPTRRPTPFITWVTALNDEPTGRMRH
jgi:hypothetical protein